MEVYWYFQPSDTLPGASGALSAHVSPAVIKDSNEAVRNALQSKGHDGIISTGENTKIRIRKLILEALPPFIRKFAQSKTSRYMVFPCH